MKYYPNPIISEAVALSRDDFGMVGTDGTTIIPTWMSQRGDEVVMLGVRGSRLYRSTDGGATFDCILNILQTAGNVVSTIATKNPEVNKSVLFRDIANDKIYRSKDLTAGTLVDGWDLVLDGPSAGTFSESYGRSLHENVLILSAYGNFNAANPPRHIYISRDYGGTFVEKEVVAIEDMVNPAAFHLHDVEFDPWANRIWVSNGDTVNGNIRYSDDWGETWTKVFDDSVRVMQSTTIMALPDRVIFGSDERPNGVRQWRRKPFEAQPPVYPEDIELVWTPDSILIPDRHIRNVAGLPSSEITDLVSTYPWNVPICLSTSSDVGNDKPGRILLTPDGDSWYEIWRSDRTDVLFREARSIRCLGPVPNHDYIYIYFFPIAIGEARIVKIKKPTWVKVD